MDNGEIIIFLENIKNMIENDEIDSTIDSINKKINELYSDVDPAADYMVNLVNQLK